MRPSVRTSVVLGLTAALLLGYILIFERGSVSSGELEQRKGSAVPEIVRARVARIELQRKGTTTVLARNPDDLDEGGLWRVEAPFHAKADSEALDTLLGALEFVNAHRRIERVTNADRKRFGLDAPRYRVWVTVGKTRLPISVGNDSPRGDGVYLQAADRTVAFVVGKDLIEALDHDATDYHTKELHDGVLASTAVALWLNDEQGERAARKQADNMWTLAAPAVGLARAPAITELITALDALRAKHFVAQDPKALDRYGLAHPRFDLRLRKTRLLSPGIDKNAVDAQGKPKREEVGMRLRVGNACQGHPSESYVTLDDTGSVSCALDTDLAKLHKSLPELREDRLLPFEDDAVQSLELDRGGRRLVLSKTNDTWSYESFRSGVPVLTGEARGDAVAAWLKALRETKFERFEPGRIPPPSSDTLWLRVERGKGKAAYAVRIDASHAVEPLAQRGDEAQTLTLAPSALDLLEPAATRVRKLALLHLDESSLRAIEIKRGSAVERLGRSSGDSPFVVEAPIRAAGDPLVVGELTRLLCSLEAVRFVADVPVPAFGLASPPIVVTLEAAGTGAAQKRVTLRLGGETADGRYAQLVGDSFVFVAPPQLAQQLAEPLVSRTLLATPLERIVAVELQQAERHLHVVRHGESFDSAAGNLPIDAKAAAMLAETVATLRASHITGYGIASPAQGMRAPYARIAVSSAQAGNASPSVQSYVILIGSEMAEGARYARRNDLEVGFVLPKDSLEKLLFTTRAK